MAEVKWIKIVTDLFDDEKILLIESLPDADKILVIWLKLLCLAGKQNNSGVFKLNDRISYNEEMFSTIFRRPLNTVRLAFETFENFGMIEVINGTVTIPNWDKHQNIEGLEKLKEQRKEINARYYQKKKLALLESSADTTSCKTSYETQSDSTDKKEIREEKKREEKIKPIELMGDFSEELCSAVLDWISYKSERRQPYKPTGLKSLIGQIRNKAAEYGDAPVINLINQCMASNWQGIIWDKLSSPNAPVSSNRNTFLEMIQEGYFDDE